MIFNTIKRLLPVCLAAALFLLTVSLPAISRAEKQSVDDVRAAVQTWLRSVTADARADAVVEKMEPYIVDGAVTAYIAHIAGGGFCLCGADDLVLPVYLYNPVGKYDPTVPGYQSVLQEIAVRTKNLNPLVLQQDTKSLQLQDELSQRSLFWENLIAGQPVLQAEYESGDPAPGDDSGPGLMELDFTPKWHQGSPYNDLCPILTPSTDEHCVVGCNATAAAQVMFYWKWPSSGVGTGQTTYNVRYRTTWAGVLLSSDPGIPAGWGGGNRLQWSWDPLLTNFFLEMNGYWDESVHVKAKTDANITGHNDPAYQAALDNLYYNKMTAQPRVLSVNVGTENYNWDLMQAVHSDPPDTGDLQVARLCYHVGVAAESDYGLWGTSATFSHPDPAHGDTSGALRDHFRYDTDIYVYPERNAETIHYLSEEIQWLRPVLLGGSNSNGGGHAYVVYGYNKGTDPNREFLMNMGWGPGSDHVWYTLDSTPFPLNQDHMIYIAPRDMVKFVGAADSGDGSPADPYLDIEEALASAPDGARLIFKADSFNTYSGTELLIDAPLTLSGHDIVIGK